MNRHILYPNEWERSDPMQNTYSPLAQFSSQTIREHDETLRKLQQQLDAIQRRLAEIRREDEDGMRDYRGMVESLQREEVETSNLLHLNRDRIEQLERSSQNEVLRRREEMRTHQETLAQYEAEMQSLLVLESEFTQMRKHSEQTLANFAQKRAYAESAFRQGLSILHDDHQQALAAAAMTDRLLVISPSRQPRSPVRARSPVRVPMPPPPSSVPVMPVHIYRTTASPPRQQRSSPLRETASSFVSRSRPLSPTRPGHTAQQTASLVASVTADAHIGLPPSGRPLPEDARRFHNACRDANDDEMKALLRLDQSLIATIDPRTRENPLHMVCSSSNVNLKAVTLLLLTDSELSMQMSGEGILPFHVACLNRSDYLHELKKYLVVQGNCDPHAVTTVGANAAHLCARSDNLHGALRFVVESLKVDPTYAALLPDSRGASRNMNALDVAIDFADAAVENVKFLEQYFRVRGY